MTVRPVEGVAERRLVPVRRPAHPGPLRAVARIDEDRTLGHGERLPGREQGMAVARTEGVERGRHLLQRAGGDHGPVRQPIARVGGGVGIERRLARRGEGVGAALGKRLERGGARRADEKRCGGRRPGRARRLARQALLHDDVRVGAAETEGVDARHARAVGRARKRGRLARHGEVQRLEAYVRVRRLDVERGGQPVIEEREMRLEDADEAGGRLEVAEVRLRRADQERRVAACREDAADRLRLDRIADARARPVRLDEGEPPRVDGEAVVDVPEEGRLRVHGWQRETGGAPVRVGARSDEAGAHRVAPPACDVLGAKHEGDRALRAHVAVRAGIERAAEPGLRQHRGAREADERHRVEEHRDAADDRRVDAAEPDVLDRVVQRDQRGRAGGVDDVARSLEIEDVGETVGDDGQRVARHRLRLDLRRVELRVRAVVERGGADVDADRLAGERGGRDAGVLQRLHRHLEHDALLRVHRRRLARRDPEVARVEGEGPGELPRGEGDRASRRATVRMQMLRRAEAALVHLGDDTAPVCEHVPEGIEPVCGRQPASRADERYLRDGHGHTQDPSVRPRGQTAGARGGAGPLHAGRPACPAHAGSIRGRERIGDWKTGRKNMTRPQLSAPARLSDGLACRSQRRPVPVRRSLAASSVHAAFTASRLPERRGCRSVAAAGASRLPEPHSGAARSAAHGIAAPGRAQVNAAAL